MKKKIFCTGNNQERKEINKVVKNKIRNTKGAYKDKNKNIAVVI